MVLEVLEVRDLKFEKHFRIRYSANKLTIFEMIYGAAPNALGLLGNTSTIIRRKTDASTSKRECRRVAAREDA
jgi:hypothetical protein